MRISYRWWFKISGFTGTQVEELYAMSAAVTKNTYTTETALSGVVGTNTVCTLPAGYFLNNTPTPVGRSLLLRGEGTIATTSAATLAVNLGFDAAAGTKAGTGGGSIAIMAATAPVAAITAPFHFESLMTCTAFTTSAYTLQINGWWAMEGSVAGGAAVATTLRAGHSGTVASLDPRITLYIELFGTWSVSAAGNTTTLQQMFLFGLD